MVRMRVAYVDMKGNDLMSDVDYDYIEKSEVDATELKPGPPYVCNLLTPANAKKKPS